MLNKYECVEVALAAYNAGSGNVDKWIKDGIIKADGSDIENIPYKETNTYVRKIMRDYKIYKQLWQTISPHLAILHPAPVILNVTRLIGVKIFIFMTWCWQICKRLLIYKQSFFDKNRRTKMILYPNVHLKSVLEITIEFLHKNQINALILDVDNTLID